VSLTPFLCAVADDDIARPLTLWVIADLDTSAGRLLYYDAIKHVVKKLACLRLTSHVCCSECFAVVHMDCNFIFQKTNGAVRLAVIHSGDAPAESQLSIAKAVGAAMATLNPSEARSFVTKLVKEEFAASLLDGSKNFQDLEVHVRLDVQRFICDR